MELHELQRATSALDIYDVDRRSPRLMRRGLDKEPRATAARLLELLLKFRIQELAKNLGIDSGGRKQELIQRILSAGSAVPQPANGSVPIEEVSVSSEPEQMNTISMFFADGVLYYKPFLVLQVTVNPFRELMALLSEDDKGRLIAFESPDAEPTAGVTPFSIVRAFQRIKGAKEPRSRVTIRHFGIESCYGLWVASRYIAEVEQSIRKASVEKAEFYDSLHGWLEDDHGRMRLREAFRHYLEDVRNTLDRTEVNWESVIEERNKMADLFRSIEPLEKRVELLKESLLHDSGRITRSFFSAVVPSFGEDERSRDEFHRTLMESLAGSLRKSNLSQAVQWVRRHGPEEIRRRLELELRRSRIA